MGFERDEISLDWRESINHKEEIKAKVIVKSAWWNFFSQMNSSETTISQSYGLYQLVPPLLFRSRLSSYAHFP